MKPTEKRRAAVLLALSTLLVVGGAWHLRGGAVAPPGAPGAEATLVDPRRIHASVDALALRLEQAARSGDAVASDWELLARSYFALQRFVEAEHAFDRAARLAPPGARRMADHAEAVLAAGRPGAVERAARLVRDALALEPLDTKALELATGPDLNPAVRAR